MLAGALSADRIPVPELFVFSGDSLKYNNWKSSVETLIDQKNIQDEIYYKYVNEQAKKVLEGYFLLRTEFAFVATWESLEERYGNPFATANKHTMTSSKCGPRWYLRTALNSESLTILSVVSRLS